MSKLDGRTAFDAILQELLQRAEAAKENEALRDAVAQAKEQASALGFRVRVLEQNLADIRKSERPLCDLWKEVEYTVKRLGQREFSRAIRAELAHDLRRRLDETASFIVHEIPF